MDQIYQKLSQHLLIFHRMYFNYKIAGESNRTNFVSHNHHNEILQCVSEIVVQSLLHFVSVNGIYISRFIFIDSTKKKIATVVSSD